MPNKKESLETMTKIAYTHLRGKELLENPLLNKGTAFDHNERKDLGLYGLLPPIIEDQKTQLERAYEAYLKKDTDLEKHIYLRALQDLNETLFYKLIQTHIVEMLPMIYDPVVGQACQHFHQIYRKPRGLFVSYPEKDQLDQIFSNYEEDDVQVIVVSDGERILGLGDQGIGGMGIPIGKISLYAACGGIDPTKGLPIILDVGTNNQERLNDPLYFGWRNPRIKSKEYEDFVEKFVQSVMRKFPNVLLQWEDFAFDHAHLLLDHYRNRLCTFNDDIQGTAAVTLAGLIAAIKATKSSWSDQKIVLLGGGSAGTGIAMQLVYVMMQEGISSKDAYSRIWIVDKVGLLLDQTPDLASFQKPFAHPSADVSNWSLSERKNISLLDVVKNVHPTILIGASTCFGAFKEDIIKEMAKNVLRPIIFPLSNPPDRCEAAPKDLIQWTEGKALIGTGTKYPNVNYKGKVYDIGQANNYYIFPAMGLAVVSTRATRVTDKMFYAASMALSELAPALKDPLGALYPSPENILDVSKHIALAAGLQAIEDGVAEDFSSNALKERINQAVWMAEYSKIQFKGSKRGDHDQRCEL